MARPSTEDADDARSLDSALNRRISINWVKACSWHTSLPWSSGESFGARMTEEGSGKWVGDICHVAKMENLSSI
eukprot:15484215-Alexandrium_andersonii.AAC.1